ncbi:N,N-dimethylformamidase beta subunit family domain-containing protein [Streptomyces sp. NPDC097619]|uniref:N,N-dimethylformamidase beta subunit family domain-containing protein n=1 Tax=Streptomyces sp. NPDC097619 TaxID=3157228 RepID=UPI00331D0216
MDDERTKGRGEPAGEAGGPGRRRVLGLAAALAVAGAGAAGTGAPARAADTPHAGPRTAPPASGTGPDPARARRAVSGCAGVDVRAENRLPGASDWRITTPGKARALEGYAERCSVLPGETIGLRISTSAPRHTVSAYRIGWYGGAGARLVWRSGELPGRLQPPVRTDPATRTARADWERTAEIRTEGWPEGCYLLRLDAVGAPAPAQRFVPLTVRSASAADRTVFVNAVGTWQAYNRWGDADLYGGPDGKAASRSLAVSFDRPYRSANGAGQFPRYEEPLLRLAERLGLPLAYATGPDLAREPALLCGARAVLSPGHDEYWSPEHRRAVAAARDAGANLAVFGANCCYRRVRYEHSAVGRDRLMVCYKDDHARDPGRRLGLPPTNDFRRQPLPEPESELLGVLYAGYPVDAPYVVVRPEHWLLAGTGAVAGDSFAHLVGVEYDRVDLRYPTPRPMEVLAHSPVLRRGVPGTADSVYASLPSGAGLFATGTMRWVEALEARGPGGGKGNHGLDGRAGDFVRTVTENVLRAFAAGPAGRARPARDSVDLHYGRDGKPLAEGGAGATGREGGERGEGGEADLGDAGEGSAREKE